MTIKGAMVAAAVAGLFATGTPAVVHAKAGKKVNCTGVNDCKGKGSCKSATNECKGKNDCKGKGMMKMSEKDCTDKGGTAAPEEGAKK
jgi:hypothetical protein